MPDRIELDRDSRPLKRAPFDKASASHPSPDVAALRNHDPAVAKAKCAVAEYLRDLGLRDPDVVASESHRIVSEAQGESMSTGGIDDVSLCETAIRLTVWQLEHWLTVVAAQSGNQVGPERLASVIAARLPVLLDQFPQALNKDRLPAELVDTLRGGLAPVVPLQRPHRMRRQVLALIPSSCKRWMRQVHDLCVRLGRAS